MDNLVTKQACLDRLTQLGIQYVLHEHDPTPSIAEVQKLVKFEANTAYVKNLFYVDKKSNYYLVLANADTQIGKLFWKSIGLSSGNMRLTAEDKIQAVLKSSKGNVNPFALVNDETDQVRKVIIDTELTKFERVSFHPIENTATIEIKLEDLKENFLKSIKKEYSLVDLRDEAQEKQVEKQVEKQGEKQVEKDDKEKQTLSITIKKSENFSKWYQQVITKSEMIEYYDISGCYILRPWSYSIWDHVQTFFNGLIQGIGVENCYFPMFLTSKQLNKEKDHVEGFKAEVAWVTKYGDSDLNEHIAIRPTSETIMYPAYSKWVKSHRDLPVKLNQWTNIVRWEFKFPTPFIRTREFLWQEGHTAHATREEAVKEVYTILDFYERIYAELYAVPVIKGLKTESEKFAGGDFTSTVETIIPQNGRGLQAATSHHLGQNFSKMFNITFEDDKKQTQFAWQTSWGISTRSLGAMVMVHGDDKGLVLPPRVARYQIVIVPVIHKDLQEQDLVAYTTKVRDTLLQLGVRAHIDDRDNYNPGWKYNHWELKGVPLRAEVGKEEIKNGEVRIVQRIDNKKFQLKLEKLKDIPDLLADLHQQLFQRAKVNLQSRIKKALNWKDFMAELNQQNSILTPWCQVDQCEQQVKKKSGAESKEQDQEEDGQVHLTGAAKTLCMPLEQDPLDADTKCFNCGEVAKKWVLWGRSY